MIFRIALVLLGLTTVGGAAVYEESAHDVAIEESLSAPLPAISVIPTVPRSGDVVVVTPPREHEVSVAVSTPSVAAVSQARPSESTENKKLREYIKVEEGCGPYWTGECLNARSGPGTEYPSVGQLRTGVVLATKGSLEVDGKRWYKIAFDEWLRYPNRITDDWYVSAEYVTNFFDPGIVEAASTTASTTKRIVVDRSEQKLYAYDGDEIFMEETISTGLGLTPTPRGTFTIFKKTPSRYMQGPLPGVSNDYYDLPGVPWNLYFTEEGGAIHGAFWHDKFGQRWSHGCVNLPLDSAEKLYRWTPVGTTVTVQD